MKSLLNQDADFEILVLDDASTDDTLSLVRSLNDERIRIFSLEPIRAALPTPIAVSICAGANTSRVSITTIWPNRGVSENRQIFSMRIRM
ncbi:glycosyltransferase [Caballeronia sp. AZ7_KS35]|uniref:glycosyltransferase n=1 Tax=Caballeronia sp. AZ7_KS35 TaxID=2921762 RepID=UPI002540872F|nr:glycosyltransferase [Caballeronia sp. AZ7_KS35]